MRSTGPTRRAKAGRADRYARIGLTPEASAADVERAHGELLSFLDGAPQGVRRWARQEISAVEQAYAAICAPAAAPAADGSALRRGAALRRLGIAALALAGAAAIVVGVYDMGSVQGRPGSQEVGTSEQRGLDSARRARIAQLMGRLKARPRDAATLVALGDAFFEAHDYNGAGGWMKRALEIDPQNATARLALGAAEFNIGDAADARREWLRVIAADPKNVEAFYDLGFLYVSRQPPDMAAAKRMWSKVVQLAPNSSVAKTVAMHIKGLERK